MNATPTQQPSKKGIELIPWSDLSPGQKAGRGGVIAVALIIVLAALRGAYGMLSGGRSESVSATQATAELSAEDRKDGIQSLCRVFQIYGIPKTDTEADSAAKNAGELFKLPGNLPPERSNTILTTIAHEFSSRQLTAKDCADAGQPVEAVSTDEGVASPPAAPH